MSVHSSFSFPTFCRYGPGVVAELPTHLRELGIQRPLVVTDGGLVRIGAFAAFERALGPSGREREWHLYDAVHPNPTEADVRGAAERFIQYGCDGVVALGGGSALDAGKAARLLVKRPGLDLAAYDPSDDWDDLAPLVAIPTTAGTGSEVGRSSVVTLAATGRKAVLGHPALMASRVLLDPELTIGLPPALTAATGADALTHCIESFTCPVFHPLCDGIALEGIHLIVEALPRAVRDGQDVDARGRMLVAAAMGAVAFQKDLGVVHSLAHPLSTICGMHHGLANALCLTASMQFCAARAPGLYRRVGVACGLDVHRDDDGQADQRTIAFVAELLGSIGLHQRLRDHGVRQDQVDALVEQAFADPCHRTNVVPVTAEDLRALYLDVL
jgi:4-hydroxybutyrate dehydrogenase